MNLSGATWSFVGATLGEAVGIYRILGVNAVDLISAPGATINAEKVITDPHRAAQQTKDLDVEFANLIFQFATNFYDRALNHKDGAKRRQNIEDFKAVAEFCRAAAVPSVTVLPGVIQEGWPVKKSLEVAAESLNEMAVIAEAKGVLLTFEAHVQSLLESPSETLAFLEANPRLKLTLDYSHFIYHGYSHEKIDPLIPFASHVHLRQGAKGVLQARMDQGTIDFNRIIRNLESVGYKGFLALEYEHDPWLRMDRVDVITETIKMRDLVLRLIT